MTNEPAPTTKPRILVLGIPRAFPATGVESFLTRRNLTDFDIVIVDPAGAIKGAEYNYDVRRSGPNTLTFKLGEGTTYRELYQEMAGRLTDFISRGGFSVVIARKLPITSVMGDEDYDMNDHMPYCRG